MAQHDDEQINERRSDAIHAERRLSALERQFTELAGQLDRVRLEQTFQRELITTRFSTMEKSIELVSTQMSGLSTSITTMASDVDKTPAGRQILREIVDLRKDLSTCEATVERLEALKNQVDGALSFARTWAVTSTVVALGSLAVLALKALKVIP